MPPLIIDDSTKDHIHSPRGVGKGYVERDYELYPVEMFAEPKEIPLIPRSDWDAIIDEQEEQQSSLEHIWFRKGYHHLDQNGQGFCWAYSGAHAIMAARARDNQPYERLSAHAVACKIMDFRDKGAWCGLSAKFFLENGCPTVAKWPEKSMSRAHDNPATWEEAARFKVTENYVDLTRPVWGQNLTFDQIMSCLLQNIPVQLDFNWWGHSVCGIRAARIERGSYGPRIVNSWPKWGDRGFATLQGNRGIPDGAVATRAVITT